MTVAENRDGGLFTPADQVVGDDRLAGAIAHDAPAALGAEAGGAASLVEFLLSGIFVRAHSAEKNRRQRGSQWRLLSKERTTEVARPRMLLRSTVPK